MNLNGRLTRVFYFQVEDALIAALGTLSARQREVLRLRFALEGGDMWTIRKISDYFQVTEARVRQIDTQALRIVRRYLLEKFSVKKPPESVELPPPNPPPVGPLRLALPVKNLELPERVLNPLENNGLRYVGDLIQLMPKDLLKLKRIGRKAVREIELALEELGLFLGTTFGPEYMALYLEAKARNE